MIGIMTPITLKCLRSFISNDLTIVAVVGGNKIKELIKVRTNLLVLHHPYCVFYAKQQSRINWRSKCSIQHSKKHQVDAAENP
jgi:hypothetical protein